MKLSDVLKFIRKYYIIITGALIAFPVVVYLLIIVPFPPSIGTDRDAWVGFLGSYFGSIVGGIFSVCGVFLTLDYYRGKDLIDKSEIENKKI